MSAEPTFYVNVKEEDWADFSHLVQKEQAALTHDEFVRLRVYQGQTLAFAEKLWATRDYTMMGDFSPQAQPTIQNEGQAAQSREIEDEDQGLSM
jgi:hypothetical protein